MTTAHRRPVQPCAGQAKSDLARQRGRWRLARHPRLLVGRCPCRPDPIWLCAQTYLDSTPPGSSAAWMIVDASSTTAAAGGAAAGAGRDGCGRSRSLLARRPYARLAVDDRPPVWPNGDSGIASRATGPVRGKRRELNLAGPQPTLVSLPVSFVGKIWVGRSALSRPTDRGSDRNHHPESTYYTICRNSE